MRQRQASGAPGKALRKIKRSLAEAGRRGQLRPVAFEGGEPVGWVGELTPDECPCCLLLAKEEETRQLGTQPRLCRQCGQTIYLHPEELGRKKTLLCYRCFIRMKPRPQDPPLRH